MIVYTMSDSRNQYTSGYILKLKLFDTTLQKYYEKAIEAYESKLENETYLDSGFDLFTPDITHNIGENVGQPIKINHQVAGAMYYQNENGYCKPTGYYMYPRSSISKTPYRLANSIGIIDSGYRGPLIAKVDFIDYGSYSKLSQEESIQIKNIVHGTRMFQICSPDLSPFIKVVLVDDLDDTTRGSGGFGSTGLTGDKE
jgi:dUTP pyrophosphatase